MSTFAQLSALPGVGGCYLLDISFDDFATTSYRWATQHVKVGSNWYDGVVAMAGNLSRELGVNNTVTASIVELTIDNTQGVADWLCDRSTFISSALKAVFKLSVRLFDPQNPSDAQSLQLGVFAMLDYPKRDNATVKLSLADDLFARGGQLAPPPSVNDWIAASDGAMPACIKQGAYGVNPDFDFAAPAPLLFGAGPHPITRISQGYYLICAVAQDRATSPSAVMKFYDKEGYPIPSSATPSPVRSANFTKNGRTWHLLYVNLDIHTYSALLKAKDYFPDVQAAASSGVYFADQDVVGPVQAVGSPFSQVSNFSGTGETAVVHPATVVQDLMTAYPLSQTTMSVNTASFDAIRSLHPWLQVNGRIQPTVTVVNQGAGRDLELKGAMASAVGALSLCGLFDTVYGKDGNVYAKALANDFATITSTPTTIDEPLMRDVQESIPSKGQRYEPVTEMVGVWNGINYATEDTAWQTTIGRKLERAVDVSWLAPNDPRPVKTVSYGFASIYAASGSTMVGFWLDQARDAMKVRPMLQFRTSMAALSLELGDLVSITWGRGSRGTPYNSARFRVEGWILSPFNADGVTLKLVWVDEAASLSLNPFLLDDETLITRVAAAGGRTASVIDGSATVTFSAGSLVTDGVAAGDILVLQDATEAVNSFNRNRALYIASVTDATHLVVANLAYAGGIFFGTGASPVAVSAWTIFRGASTYPTAISDPTNYPSGGAMYGKISNSAAAGFFYDGSTKANIMQDG